MLLIKRILTAYALFILLLVLLPGCGGEERVGPWVHMDSVPEQPWLMGGDPTVLKQSAIGQFWLLGNTSYINGTTATPIKDQALLTILPTLPLRGLYEQYFGNFAIGNPSHSNYLNLQFWNSGTQYVGTVTTVSDDGAGGVWACPNCAFVYGHAGDQMEWAWNGNTGSANFTMKVKHLGTVVSSATLSLGYPNGTPLNTVYSPQMQFGAASGVDCWRDFPYANDGGHESYVPMNSHYGIGASANLFVPFTVPKTQSVCDLHVTNEADGAAVEWDLAH